MSKPPLIDDGLVMYYVSVLGLPYSEAAEMLGTDNKYLKSRMYSIRTRRAASGLPETLSPDELSGLQAKYGKPGTEELMQLASSMMSVAARLDPVITHIDIDLSAMTAPVAVCLFGCFQTGGRWTFHQEIKKALDGALSHPRMRVGMLGDEIENFLPGSFAGARSVMEQALPPFMQFALWESFLDEIDDRVLFATGSQHGAYWEEKLTGTSRVKQAYLQRGIKFLDGMGYVRIRVGEQTYHMAVAHEFPGNSMYNPVHPHKRALWQRFPNADVIAMADRHQSAVHRENVYGNEVLFGNRASSAVYLLQVGTAKGGPDPYTIRGWERGQVEWPIVVFFPDEHKVKVSEDLNDIHYWLGE